MVFGASSFTSNALTPPPPPCDVYLSNTPCHLPACLHIILLLCVGRLLHVHLYRRRRPCMHYLPSENPPYPPRRPSPSESLEKRPVFTKSLSSGLIGLLGDLTAQSVEWGFGGGYVPWSTYQVTSCFWFGKNNDNKHSTGDILLCFGTK